MNSRPPRHCLPLPKEHVFTVISRVLPGRRIGDRLHREVNSILPLADENPQIAFM